jgi:hypothetical protein
MERAGPVVQFPARDGSRGAFERLRLVVVGMANLEYEKS